MTERPTTYNSGSESFLILHVDMPQTDVLVVAAEGPTPARYLELFWRNDSLPAR